MYILNINKGIGKGIIHLLGKEYFKFLHMIEQQLWQTSH